MQNFQTRLKELWESIKGFFKKLNKTVRILLGVCLAVILVIAAAVVVKMNQTEYATLCTGLTASETSSIVTFLSDNGVTDYKIQNDSILVPKGRVEQLQTQLVLSGNLTSGYLYDYYTEHAGGLSTTEESERAWLISVQQRLEIIIKQFDGVQSASVMISPGTERIYVLQDSAVPATATVQVTPDGNRLLSDNVVRAIRYTVSHSVAELHIEDVNVEDIYGNPYSDTDAVSRGNQATDLKFQYEERISNNVRNQIINFLGHIYGYDNVTVSVLCTVDVSHKIIDKTEYEQPDGSVVGGGLVIGDHLFYERIQGENAAVGGTVGTTTNSDVNYNFPNYPDLNQDLGEGDAYLGNQIDRDIVVNEIKQQEEVLEGRLTDLRVIVAVNQNCTNAGALTIDALRDNVATLAGISGNSDPLSRVSVNIAPFEQKTDIIPPSGMGGIFDMENSWILYAAIGGLVLFLVLLFIIILLARRRRKKRRAEEEALEEEMAAQAAAEAAAVLAAMPPTGGADIMEVNTEKSMELRKEVRQFAQNNPEIAAQMVRAWLKGEESGG